MKNQQTEQKNAKSKSWIKKVGIGGLIFFTIKGLVWLVIFYFGADALKGCFG